MKYLIPLLLLSLAACGNNFRPRQDIRNLVETRLTFGVSTPADAILVLGTPDETGVRGSTNRYLRYNVKEGGFVEVGFLNDLLSTMSEPSTY